MNEGFLATILKQKNDLNKRIAVNQNIINLYIKKEKVNDKILQYFSKMEDKIVQSTKDKSMPQFVQNLTEDVITNVWHDVTDLVRFELHI